MQFLTWIWRHFSARGRATLLYKRGVFYSHRQDYSAAIKDYSSLIDERALPIDLKAMALFNRALAYAAVHQETNALDDLHAVLAIPRTPARILSVA